MDWIAFPFVEYFPSERFSKWEDWKLYYLDAVEVLQMSEDQAMGSMLYLLRGWALQAVLDLPFRFWLSETGEVVMSLGQYFDIIEKRLSTSREENCYGTNSSNIRGRIVMVVMEEKLESENDRLKCRIKDSLNENSEENFELSEVGPDLVGTRCNNQDEAARNFQNVVDLLQLDEEQAERLGLSMLGEVNREEQVDIKYRYDQRNGQEIIVIPNEWLETIIASKKFGKESIENFDEGACRGNEVEECKMFDEEKELVDRELRSQFKKKGMATPGDTEAKSYKEQRSEKTTGGEYGKIPFEVGESNHT